MWNKSWWKIKILQNSNEVESYLKCLRRREASQCHSFAQELGESFARECLSVMSIDVCCVAQTRISRSTTYFLGSSTKSSKVTSTISSLSALDITGRNTKILDALSLLSFSCRVAQSSGSTFLSIWSLHELDSLIWLALSWKTMNTHMKKSWS